MCVCVLCRKQQLWSFLYKKPEGCAVGLPVGPGLLCKKMMMMMMMSSGSGHYSALVPYCTAYWSPVTRRKALDWMYRTASSWADKTEVCETWSPSWIVCCETRMRNPVNIIAR